MIKLWVSKLNWQIRFLRRLLFQGNLSQPNNTAKLTTDTNTSLYRRPTYFPTFQQQKRETHKCENSYVVKHINVKSHSQINKSQKMTIFGICMYQLSHTPLKSKGVQFYKYMRTHTRSLGEHHHVWSLLNVTSYCFVYVQYFG